MFSFANLGMPSYIFKFYPYYEDNLDKKRNDILTWALLVSFIGFCFVVMGGIYFKDLIIFKFGKNSPEYFSGHGGADGSDVIKNFLNALPMVLNKNGIGLLGVNNKYLQDEKVIRIIKRTAGIRLTERYYSKEQVPPFSQVYIVEKLSS
jgi:hypothetical protein